MWPFNEVIHSTEKSKAWLRGMKLEVFPHMMSDAITEVQYGTVEVAIVW
jgi:hypothetical protein